MAEVISIHERIARQRGRTSPVDGGEAAILLFTGIRYERFEDSPAAGKPLQNKAKRVARGVGKKDVDQA
ncbi:hypothetical protein ACQQ2Q_02375 [Agrobacterium sp. ES01]|uniref:hypothetical protein n=1 Tax=Agrobacterium sp. ES01 TaxID=3420714 RepID=UPI003D0A3701